MGLLAQPHSPGQVQCSTPPWLLVLDYNPLLMLSSFVGGGFNLPGPVLDYVPQGLGGGVLQVSLGSFETSWRREMVCHFYQG
jgi:hypothetical protein